MSIISWLKETTQRLFHREHFSLSDAKAVLLKKRTVPQEYLTFVDNYPNKVRQSIRKRLHKHTFDPFGFLSDFPVISQQTSKAQNAAYKRYADRTLEEQAGAVSLKTQKFELQQEILRVEEELGKSKRKLRFLNTVYRRDPNPPDDPGQSHAPNN